MPKKDTVGKTIRVALALCVVCSVLVSAAAVVLKPAQQANQLEDRQRNILAAAGLLEPGVPVSQQFANITARAVNLETGEFTDAVDPQSFDQVQAAKDPSLSSQLGSEQDKASIGRRENVGLVYIVGDADQPETVIIPVRGAGLWGQMYGFLALDSDIKTVAGIGFYEHKETPGLGGEIDNPRWKSLWPGKVAFRDGEVAIEVIKGSVDRESSTAAYKVDGLSGATLTTRGVSNLVQFWLGDYGYGPFLSSLKAGEA
ncbi:MAG: Na(+)-translocating NADH-quinone reductase subunit C [Halieaceae bacterium]|nr:Na(+)-translocating NADH-quinone reductase subunit C [Halieaceae bacterium]